MTKALGSTSIRHPTLSRHIDVESTSIRESFLSSISFAGALIDYSVIFFCRSPECSLSHAWSINLGTVWLPPRTIYHRGCVGICQCQPGVSSTNRYVITYPCLDFVGGLNKTTIEVKAWMGNYISSWTMDLITYPCPNASQLLLVKWSPPWMVNYYPLDYLKVYIWISILIPTWISNHMPSKVWDDITYPFSNFNSCTIAVWEWLIVSSCSL